jgi:DNA-binding NarL/FixJ family response regulator
MSPGEHGLAAAEPASAPAPRRKVLLVDDHPVTRQGLAALLAALPEVEICGEADHGARAVELAARLDPDLAIVDVALRTMSGIELVKHLRGVAPRVKILVVSMHDEAVYAERSLRAGAQGYLMKDAAGDEIAGAVRRILAGDVYLSPAMRARQVGGGPPGEPSAAAAVARLSDRELEVLELIGRGYGTREIAGRLGLSSKTIDSYREHLKSKLHLAGGPQLARFAIEWCRSRGL